MPIDQTSTGASPEGSRPPSPTRRSPPPWPMKQDDEDGEEELASTKPHLARELSGSSQSPASSLTYIRLRHCWPKMKEHYAEARRKLGLLNSAIREHSASAAITHEAASREFRTYCRHARARVSAGQLSFTQLLIALRDMGGQNYDALCFRHAVMARPTGQLSSTNTPSQAKAEAEHVSNEQMLCFLRLLDNGDNGFVTHRHFCSLLANSASASS